jgi:hypothetical protein
MADPIPTNAGVLGQQRNVFSNHWFTYLSQLETANLQGDFSGITPLDPGANLTDVINKVNEILEAAQG